MVSCRKEIVFTMFSGMWKNTRLRVKAYRERIKEYWEKQ